MFERCIANVMKLTQVSIHACSNTKELTKRNLNFEWMNPVADNRSSCVGTVIVVHHTRHPRARHIYQTLEYLVGRLGKIAQSQKKCNVQYGKLPASDSDIRIMPHNKCRMLCSCVCFCCIWMVKPARFSSPFFMFAVRMMAAQYLFLLLLLLLLLWFVSPIAQVRHKSARVREFALPIRARTSVLPICANDSRCVFHRKTEICHNKLQHHQTIIISIFSLA